MIAWTPAEGEDGGAIEIRRLTDDWPTWSDRYRMSGGAAYALQRRMNAWRAVAFVMIEFHSIVMRDRVNIGRAHAEFMKIDEYRWHVCPELGKGDAPEEYISAMGVIDLTPR